MFFYTKYFTYICHVRNIERLLREKGASMYQLANAIGESHPRTNYLVKHKNITADLILLQKVAEFLDCKLEDLIDK